MPHPRPFAVPDLTCDGCRDLTAEVEAKAEIIHRLGLANTELAEELSGARTSLGVAGKRITALEQQIVRQARKSARSEQVEAVIEHWKKHRPKTRASSFPPGGKNWQIIEKALSLMAEDEDGPVRACCEAIDGLHIAPFESYGKRYMRDAPGRTLRNRLEHALGDETRIERCRGIVRRVRESPTERVFELWRQACMTEQALLGVLWERFGDQAMPAAVGEPRFVVDGVVTDGRAA